MEFAQLRSFLAVAEYASMTRAADCLYLTQPAVTQHIQALERELGVTLFERTRRGMQLTESGSTLRDYVRQSMAVLDEGKQRLVDLGMGIGGHLAIGAGVTTSIFQLPAWLQRFQQTYPTVEVTVQTGGSKLVAAMVRDRTLDVGLVTSPVDESDLIATRLFDEEIALIIPPKHPAAASQLTLDELSTLPLIPFPFGTGFRDYLNTTLRDVGISMRVKMETDSVEAIKSFVAVGLGVSFLPISAVASEIAAGTLARAEVCGLPPMLRTTSVIYRSDRYLSAATQGFLVVLTEGKGP